MESKQPTLPEQRKTYNPERHIAIDTFPVMDEDAVEGYWIQMVEKRRQQRTTLFKKWLEEAEVDAKDAQSVTNSIARTNQELVQSQTVQEIEVPTIKKIKKKKKLTLDELEGMSTTQLRKLLTSTSEISDNLRLAITTILDKRWDQLEVLDRMKYTKDEL